MTETSKAVFNFAVPLADEGVVVVGIVVVGIVVVGVVAGSVVVVGMAVVDISLSVNQLPISL